MEQQGERKSPEEAGWYRDPAPANPAFPTTVRYWDGSQWTGQTRSAKKSERQSWEHELARERYAQAVAYQERLVQTATPVQIQAIAAAQGRVATPDGQLLSGWWRRVGAAVLDSLIAGILGVVLGWQFVGQIKDAYAGYVDAVVAAQQAGTPIPDPSTVQDSVAGAFLGLVVVLWLVGFVYNVGFLKAFGATPGKMVVGIEVRLRERPGPMSWGTVLLRWLIQNLGTLLALIPLLGLVSWVYTLLDRLWPLWDGHRQAIHDHVARTNVVRRR